MRPSLLVILIVLLLASCGLSVPFEDLVTPTPDTPAENPTPTPVPWTISSKRPHSGMFGIAWNPSDTKHPLLTTDRVNRELYTLMFDSLFVLDQEFNAHERLCSGIATADNRIFTLTLRRGVVFSDGGPLTPQDVINSFQTARSAASPYAARLSCIESVRQEGDNVEVTLYEPNPRFAALLTFPIVRGNSFPWVGTGAYAYAYIEDSESESERSYLQPSASHWEKRTLPVKQIELVAVDKLEDITYLMSVGDISIVTSDFNDSFRAGFGGDFDEWEYPTPTMYYVGFNMSHPLLSDKRARRALSAAFDRSELAADVFGGAADAVSVPVPAAIYDSGDNYNLRLFTSLVIELGLEDTDEDGFLEYKRGRVSVPFTLRLVIPEEDVKAGETAGYLVRMLISMGIDITVVPLPNSSYTLALQSGDYDLYCEKITLPADFQIRRWMTVSPLATSTSLASQYTAFLEEMPIAPLLFKRERTLTHWSEVSGIVPVYGTPYVNIYDWTVKQ